MLTDNIMDYYFVAQGKTTIPGVDDAEELTLTDVRLQKKIFFLLHLFLVLTPVNTFYQPKIQYLYI